AAFSAAVREDNKLYCWKTNPMFSRRKTTFAEPFSLSGSIPITASSPPDLLSRPPITQSSVVLPHPLNPTSKVISPKFASKSTPFNARTRLSPEPKSFVTCRQLTAECSAMARGESMIVLDIFCAPLAPEYHRELEHGHASNAHQT